jgi:hypothetical protein
MEERPPALPPGPTPVMSLCIASHASPPGGPEANDPRVPFAPDSEPPAWRRATPAPRGGSSTPDSRHSVLDRLRTTIQRRSPTPDLRCTNPWSRPDRLRGGGPHPEGQREPIRDGRRAPDSLEPTPDPSLPGLRRSSPRIASRRPAPEGGGPPSRAAPSGINPASCGRPSPSGLYPGSRQRCNSI